MKNAIRCLLLGSVFGLIFPLTARAAQFRAGSAPPTTRSSVASPEAHERGGGGRGGMRGPIDPQLWNEAAAFTQAHAPHRWQAFEQLPESPEKDRIKRAIVMRYRAIQSLADDQPLYAKVLHRIALEDDAWQLAARIRQAATEADRQTLRDQLTKVVRELVSLSFDERQARLGHLQSMLQQQQRKLEEDRAHPEELVAKQVQAWEQESGAAEPVLPGGPRRGDREGRGEGRGGRESRDGLGARGTTQPSQGGSSN